MVDLEYLGRESWMPLFVVLRDGIALDDALTKRIAGHPRGAVGAPRAERRVPGERDPAHLSGKKMELPVKKLLLGADPDRVLKRDAMANAQCVDWFVELAAARAKDRPAA